MGYLHFDLTVTSSSKHPGAPCGDVVMQRRTAEFTWVVLADGLGHGVKAQIQAALHASRLTALLGLGYSFREAFCEVASSVDANRTVDLAYAALVAARVRPDGEATVLTYDAPPAIFLGKRSATVLPGRAVPVGAALVYEANCFVEAGEGLLLMSDGVTQAGLGQGLAEGWTSAGVASFVSSLLGEGVNGRRMGGLVHDRARELWRHIRGDDVTTVLMAARPGKTLAILTGPPARRSDDAAVVSRFMATEGLKAVCGASTAKVVACHTATPLRVEQNASSSIAPPRYFLDGIDLVTEGAVTLNQVLNILGEDPARYEPDSGVSELAQAMLDADRIDFFVGNAPNMGGKDIAFLQQGIQPRRVVIPLLVSALESKGKLVTCSTY